jgi:hypothetical protein
LHTVLGIHKNQYIEVALEAAARLLGVESDAPERRRQNRKGRHCDDLGYAGDEDTVIIRLFWLFFWKDNNGTMNGTR